MKASKGRISRKSRLLGRRAGTLTVAAALRSYEIGTKVQIVPYFKREDFPHPRYAGRVGRVMGRQGNAFVVEVMEGSKRKYLITSPVHLKAAE